MIFLDAFDLFVNISLHVWYATGIVVCSELFANVVFRLMRFVVKVVISHVVVRRQTRTDTDKRTQTDFTEECPDDVKLKRESKVGTHTDTDTDTHGSVISSVRYRIQ